VLIAGLAIAGAAGAIARFAFDDATRSRLGQDSPVGILCINIAGSFVLGCLTGLALYHSLASTPKTVLGTGFCGGFTTFSTFAYESVRLAHDNKPRIALVNVALHLVLPALAAAAGIALTAL
jgi:CrcB protein